MSSSTTRRLDMCCVAKRVAVVALVAFSVHALGRPVHAGPITLNTVATAGISPGFFDQDTLAGTLSAFTDLQLTSAASGSFNTQNLTSSLNVSGYAFIRALGGSLSMGVQTLSDNDSTIGAGGPVISTTSTGTGQAAINVSDGLTVFSGPGSGTLALNFDISGSLSGETSGPTSFANRASASGTFFVNTNTNPANVLSLQASSQEGAGGDTGDILLTFPSTWTVLIPYTSSFANMSLHLDSTAFTSNACQTTSLAATSTCSETALGALGNTFTLSFIQVLDQSGQVVPGAFATGSSGITYNNVSQTPVPVPEPASLVLLSSGIACVVFIRYRRRIRC